MKTLFVRPQRPRELPVFKMPLVQYAIHRFFWEPIFRKDLSEYGRKNDKMALVFRTEFKKYALT